MRVVVISPHPDDETLGAGGTLLKLKRNGHQIFWINVTDVNDSGVWKPEFVKKRSCQIKQIEKTYGFEKTYNLKLPPSSLEDIEKSSIISKIKDCFEDIMPNWVILPNPYDAHKDHTIVYEAAMACTKIFRYPYIRRITTMEIVSETDFSTYGKSFEPNLYIDISDTMEEKIKAIQIYDTELGEPPFPRSLEAIRALGIVRGGAAGVRYAEAFHVIKEIE